MDIPTKHPMEFKQIIRRYAAEVDPDNAVVELGTFHGAGTLEIAAATEAPILTYDWFKQGQLGEVYERLQYFPHVEIIVGEIRDVVYDGPPIELFVDDASKNLFPDVFPIFEPHLIDGAVLVLQDFHHEVERMHAFVAERGWEHVDGFEPADGCAVFIYKKELTSDH